MGESSAPKAHRQRIGGAFLACKLGERLRGKLKDGKDVRDVCILAPCHAIHTVGMAYPLDVAFVGKGERVVYAERNVPPGQHLRHAKARFVLERAAEPQRAWFETGEHVRIHLEIDEKRSA